MDAYIARRKSRTQQCAGVQNHADLRGMRRGKMKRCTETFVGENTTSPTHHHRVISSPVCYECSQKTRCETRNKMQEKCTQVYAGVRTQQGRWEGVGVQCTHDMVFCNPRMNLFRTL